MEKKFQITVKVKNCNTKFMEILEPGVIGTKEIVFEDITEEDIYKPMFQKALMDLAKATMNELVEYEVKEI